MSTIVGTARTTSPLAAGVRHRPVPSGKFLGTPLNKLYVRGVTYGPFRPDDLGNEYRTPETVRADFEQMARNGINAVRTYTIPPRWVVEAAEEYGLHLMLGI